eukprot:gene5930-biopygen5959
MALEPIVMLSAAQAAKEINAYRRRHSGSGSDPAGPPHDVLLAFATPAIGSYMLPAVATAEDLPDADVTPEWREKSEQRCSNCKPSVIRETLPHYDDLKREDFAHIRMQAQWDGAAPNKRPYKMSMVESNQLRERLDELLSKGYYIRPSSSPFAAPCLMVPKPGKPRILRLVIAYRLLNSQTVNDRYPLPDIQQLFDEMHGAKYFSSFDAVDGFWQMAMAPEDVEKTAFTSHYGSYEWLVMPMGAFRGSGKRGRKQLVPHRVSARGPGATVAAEPPTATGAGEVTSLAATKERSPEVQFPIPAVPGGAAGGTPWAGHAPRLPRRASEQLATAREVIQEARDVMQESLIDWQNDLRWKIEEIRASDEPYRGIPYMGRRPRSPAPEPGEEVTLPVGPDDSPPDLDDALGDDSNATTEVAEVEMPTEREARIHGSEQPDVSETIESCKMTTVLVVTSSDDDSDPRSKEEAPRRKKARVG